ncbi:c-type cytochrome [Acidovorax sp. D4N7]|nr:c-type cytochrome [Acidovorax sp. D4N7]MCD2514088.1 c-type cytochrome [Acidovorax sp. D4N7]
MAWRVQACSACHGDQGRATPEGYFPRLAGKPADYLFRQMQNFRDGRRNHTQMRYLMAHLTDDYLREMAGFFARREVPYPPPLQPQAGAQALARGEALVRQGDAARGLPACVACHGTAMTGVLPAVPGLLGLSRDYLNSQLGAWRTGQRHAQDPDCMAAIAQKLSAPEVAAVSAWLAAQPVPEGGKPATQPSGPAPMACAGLAAAAWEAR